MVPYILYKIQSLIEQVRNSPNISLQVANLSRRMANVFELHWGCGEPGTVATEYLAEGPNRCPRGLPIITLLASLIDPRFKCGVGLALQDREYLWNVLLHQMIGIERVQRATARHDNMEVRQHQGNADGVGVVEI
jgi:hypothetical protein